MPTLPTFIGNAAVPPGAGVAPAWQNPFMAPNPSNNVHNDAWRATTTRSLGGRSVATRQTLLDRHRTRLHHAELRPPGQLIGIVHRPRPRARRCTCSTRARSTRSPSSSCRSCRRRPAPTRPRTRPAARTSTSTTTTAWSSRRRTASILVVGGRARGGTPGSSRSPTTTRRRACRRATGCRRCSRRPGTAVVRRSLSGRRRRARSATGHCRSVDPPRGDRELVRGRARRRLHRDRQGDVQVPRGQEPRSEDRLADALPQHRHAEDRTDQRRLRHDADPHRHRWTGHARQDRDRRTSRSPTTPTRSTSSSTAPRIDSARTSGASSARSRCSARARAPTRTR